jgi:hypothetical protein
MVEVVEVQLRDVELVEVVLEDINMTAAGISRRSVRERSPWRTGRSRRRNGTVRIANNSVVLSPLANYTDRAIAAVQRS